MARSARTISTPASPAAVANAIRAITGPTIADAPLDLTVELAAGTYGGFHLDGLEGKYGVTIQGTHSAVTPTTGASSGTAGVGTNTTTLVKPTGASNWTASDLVGSFLKITSGGGSGTVRPILANTTTTLTVHAVGGMDSTSVFTICRPGTTVTEDLDAPISGSTVAVYVANCSAPVTLKGLRFSGTLDYLVRSDNNALVVLDGCLIDVAASVKSVYSTYDTRFVFKNCLVKTAAGVYVEDCAKQCRFESNLLSNGTVRLDRCLNGYVQLEAQGCAGNALYAAQVHYLQGEVKATTCTATPVVLDGVAYFEATGTNKLTGSNPSASYGLSINRSGRYNLVGCDIAGAADVDFDGTARPWSLIGAAGYGVAQKYGSTLVAYATQAKAVVDGNYYYGGELGVSGRFYLDGYCNLSNKGGLVATGTTSADALALGQWTFNEFSSVPNNAGCLLPAGAALPGCLCAIYNAGGNGLKVYAPPGGVVAGGASVTIDSGKWRLFMSRGASGLSWLASSDFG